MSLFNPIFPRTLFKSNIPFIIPSSGSMANNGALTVTTALAYIYPKAYIYLPANAIVAGSAAGWYYAVFSSTTVAQVFNNTYDPAVGGEPAAPASPTAFVTTGPGAYTQDVAAGRQGPSFTLPAGTLGPNGRLRFEFSARVASNANVKSIALRQNVTGLAIPPLASTVGINVWATIDGLGATNSQAFQTFTSIAGGTHNTPPQMLTLDTTAALPFNIFPLIATATDYIVMGPVRVTLEA